MNQKLHVRDLKTHLERNQISPETLAKRAQLSHMTIRRWLKKDDAYELPRKYYALLEPILSSTHLPPGLPGELSGAAMENLMKEVEKSGENYDDVRRLESDLRTKLRTTRFDKIFIDHCRSLLQALKSAKTPLKAKAVCVGALLYFISPIDLIPDNIPVLGYLDDLAVLTLAIDIVGRASAEKIAAEAEIG